MELQRISTDFCRLRTLFLVNVHNVLKFCLFLLKAVGIHVPIRNFRGFPLFSVDSSRKTCPSARCSSAANAVCKDIDIFSKHLVALIHTLQYLYS
jgi:hypothetical protein